MNYLNPHTHKLDGQAETPAKTLAEMSAEVRANNISKGWRTPDGYETRSFPEGLALIHSEISEALEAYRDHGLADATAKPAPAMNVDEANRWTDEIVPAKPEGVGSELADVLIRLLDFADGHDVKLFDMDMELADVADAEREPAVDPVTVGDHLAWLHFHVSSMLLSAAWEGALALRVLVTTARKFGIDLMAEYERKMAYNRTRPFRHGGRAL